MLKRLKYVSKSLKYVFKSLKLVFKSLKYVSKSLKYVLESKTCVRELKVCVRELNVASPYGYVGGGRAGGREECDTNHTLLCIFLSEVDDVGLDDIEKLGAYCSNTMSAVEIS